MTKYLTDYQELRRALNEVVQIDIDKELVRTDELGEDDFSESRQLFKRIVEYANMLRCFDWTTLPEAVAVSPIKAMKALEDKVKEVRDFRPDAGNTYARDEIANELTTQFDRFRSSTVPVIGFLSWEARHSSPGGRAKKSPTNSSWKNCLWRKLICVVGFVLPIGIFVETFPPRASLPTNALIKNNSNRKELLQLEYREASEGFRHIYATAWNAGAALFVTSGAIIGLGANAKEESILAIGLIPIALWFWGIFWWMDQHGNTRAHRLAVIETLLSEAADGENLRDDEMCFYREYTLAQRPRWAVKHSLHFMALAAVVVALLLAFGVLPSVFSQAPSAAMPAAP